MELLITFHDGREPERLQSQAPTIVLRGFGRIGVSSVPNAGELVGERTYGASSIDKIEVSGHPEPVGPEPPAEYEDLVVTPESFFGAPAPYGGDQDEQVTLRVRKQAEPEPTKKGG